MKHVYCVFLFIASASHAQELRPFSRFLETLEQSQIDAASAASNNGQLYERRQNWGAALHEYQTAAEFLKTSDTAPGCLLRSSANLDVARMLDKLNRRFSIDYTAAVRAATESSRRALELESRASLQAPPAVQAQFVSLQSSTYLNLGLAQSMSGDLTGARNEWQKGLSLQPRSSTLLDSMNNLNTLQRQMAIPSNGALHLPTNDQSREWAIGVGIALAAKEYPVAAPVIGATLLLINHMYSPSIPVR